MNRDIFEDLFVLEMTNNHLGQLDRGIRIVEQYARIARFNNVRVAIKLQFRDIDTFIHKDFRSRTDIRYIKRTLETRMEKPDYERLVEVIRKSGCIPMATPFDEKSVDWCVEFNMPIIKIASADSNDWVLIEKIAKTKKPVIVSFGGATTKDMDDLVTFFQNRNIPLAINHCVAVYPHGDAECELNQIDYLKKRYPECTIGWSSHENTDWTSSIMMAYAKGARTFERHVDIVDDGAAISAYSMKPEQIDAWFKAWHKAQAMCGGSSDHRKVPLRAETDFLDNYIRGVYARHDLVKGQKLTDDDVYLSIPLQKGQISCRELMLGNYGHRMLADVKKDAPITIDQLDTPYAANEQLKKTIFQRGLQP